MKLDAAVAMQQMAKPEQGGDSLNQQQSGPLKQGDKDPARGAFGRLIPVNQQMHDKLTKSGYKHDANYLTNSGQGNFGYYSHPVSGHKITVDQMGNVQNYEEPKPAKGSSSGGGQALRAQRKKAEDDDVDAEVPADANLAPNVVKYHNQ